MFSRFVYPYPNFPSSPDEKTALTYANQVSHGGSFLIPAAHDIPSTLNAFLYPRSTVFHANQPSIQYASYLGLPAVYGLFLKILPIQWIFALVGALGVFLVYRILRQLQLSNVVSLFGAALYATNPFILYYTARGGMHQILFLDFLLASLVCLVYGVQREKWIWLVCAGSLLGFAAATRTNEMLWAVPLSLAVFIWISRKQHWVRNAVSFCLGAIISFLPFVGISRTLSGSLTQYRSISTEAVAQSGSVYVFLKSLIFPFGFNISAAVSKFWKFSMQIWWVLALLLIALVVILFRLAYAKKWKSFWLTFFCALLGFYTILFYGTFPQELPRNIIWVSHSHFRYWLPLFASSSIVAAFCISMLKNIKVQSTFFAIIVPFFAIGSFVFIMFGNGGLTETRYRNILDYQKNLKMHSAIPSNAIVLAGKADKFIYPDWVVAGTSLYDSTSKIIDILKTNALDRPVYFYYSPLDGDSKKTLTAIQNSGIETKYVTMLFEGETLYQLVIPHS